MRKDRLAQFKKKLEEKHRQLAEGVGKTVLYAKGPDDDSTKDLGDQAATSYNREFLFELSNGDRRVLKEVVSALQKIDGGNFGDCERCGETIADKRLEAVRGTSSDGAPFAGYEMHMGVTAGLDCARPFARLADGAPDGAISPDGRVVGTYVHGLFADDRQRAAWLARFGGAASIAYDDLVERTLDALAAHLAAHLDLDRLLTLAQ